MVFNSIEAEHSYLQGRTSTPTGASRRQFKAGSAANLKNRNLIPPLHTPKDRRISLPRASKTPSVAMPDKRKTAPNRETQYAVEDTVTEPTPSEKVIKEQLATLTTSIGGVEEDIGQAKTRTVEKIDSKVDDLATRLGTRMSKAETDLTRPGTEIASTREQLQTMRLAAEERERALPGMIDTILKTQNVLNAPGRRHRPVALDATVPSAPARTGPEEKYWVSRGTLQLWPVVGDKAQLKNAVVNFLEQKLACPPGRVSPRTLTPSGSTALRVYCPPDLTAQNQVVVTFASVGLRDEVKSMSRNFGSTDRKTGVQIEPPDHLRGQYQEFQRLAFQLKRKNPEP